MFRSLWAAFAVWLCVVLSPLGALAQDAEIKGVISSQLDAFQVDDFERAFTFASPNIKRMFRTPENFGSMVQRGYPMVWRPSDVRFGALEMSRGQLVQKVFLVDQQGAQYVALYTMAETGEGWKINGVEILRPSDVGT